MSMYQMAIMGASAIGAAIWGQVATVSNLEISLAIAAASGTLLMLMALRWVTDGVGEDDTRPAEAGWAAGPPAEAPQEDGRVVITVEDLIEPARAAAFHLVMQQTRRARLSQ